MSRKLIIAGNWKMNYTMAETKAMLTELKAKVADIKSIDIAICPTFTSLATAVEVCRGSNVGIGAQNVHWEASGAFTGEISTEMLRELAVEYVIIGHSERRQFFGETNESVNQRLHAALAAGLKPMVCCGETYAQRQGDETEAIVSAQIKAGLAGLTDAQMAGIVIAYEPVWAIGTGLTASPQQAQDVHALIRNLVREMYGAVADKVRIQYGGSVKASNVAELMSCPDIDGALVGGASLKAEDFSQLLHNAQ